MLARAARGSGGGVLIDRAAPVLALLVLLLLLLPCTAARAAAQQTDILTGTVRDVAGAPLGNAAVTATALESGIRRSTLTNAQGRYTIIFPDGEGSYELEVARIGMAPFRMLVTALPSEDVLVNDIRLEVAPVALDEVTVTAMAERVEVGARERELEPEWLAKMPIDPTNVAALAELDPAITGLERTDSLGSGGFSVFGQRPDLNNVSVDGVSFGSPRGGPDGELGIPAEAVRLTRVITNSYDVSRGQFSGGQISATTRGGTNRREGSVTYSIHEPRLQWEPTSSYNRAFRQHRLSMGYGGPIQEDRAFYFVSGAIRHRTQDFASLVQADVAALEQLGAHADSVARFFDILGSHDLSPFDPVPVGGQLVEEVSLFTRLDFVLSERHSLMLRADGRSNQRDGTRVNTLGLPHSGGGDLASGGGVMVGLTSRLGDRLVNEFRAYLSRQESDAEPYFPVPEGRVRVASILEDGTRSVSNLVFGGNRSLPVTSRERTLEMSNELSWLLGARHRVKIGGLLHATRSAQEFSPTQYGTFTFNSLEEFAENRPTSFTRSLTSNTREGGGANMALYVGDIWQVSREVQLTMGMRAEGSVFGRKPQFNPAVDSLFGRRTDQFPAEFALTPRFGFTYTVPPPARNRPSPLTVRGGVGLFRGRPPFSLYSTALDATGLPDGQVQIVCVGEVVPAPDWKRFRGDAGEIPSACADGVASQPSSGRAPNVTLFRSDFNAPLSWRGSLEAERRIGRDLTLTVSGTRNFGASLYGVRDLNLDETPRFTLPAEGDRPVYVAPEDIVQGTGSVGILGSRVHPEFGQVLELHSDLRSRSTQWSVSARYNRQNGISARGSYTYETAVDESSFSCCSATQAFGSPTTSANPNDAEWSLSDYSRPHSINVSLGYPVRPWAEVTVIARSASGAPYTPLVGGDVNGDGSRNNDRAFVFDPASAGDPELAAAMARLLSNASPRIRACLETQLGRVAERNSCRGPRVSAIELRSNLRPELPWGVGRRITASIASQNLLTGLDQLIHGSGSVRGWGQRSQPDPTLLYVRGFDPASHTFRYELNEGFGNARRGRIQFGSPFQLHLEARVALGEQRQSN